MNKALSPSRLRLDTSPPLREGEDGSQAGRLSSPPGTGGEVAPRSGDGLGEGGDATRSRPRNGATTRARNLRQGGNQAEALLWRELKNRKLGGYRFTRQFPIGPYFADFCCRERWLVVEIDGSQHADSTYDRRRDEFMRAHGYSVLRFWNHDVLKHRTSVCETILAALEGLLAENVAAYDLRFVYARHEMSRRALASDQQFRPALRESLSERRDPSP